MTQEEKRIKLAQACGWSLQPHETRGLPVWRKLGIFTQEGWEDHFTYELPNYFNDLNECHNLEEILDSNQWEIWHRIVSEWTENHSHVTAEQRAEALGLTLELWRAGE